MAATERPRSGENIPAALTSFLGRRQELTEARALLATARLLTMTGMGGVGKTRLALQLAATLRRAFSDGVWLVELADLTDPRMVPQTVAGALGLRDESAAPAVRLAEHLADKQMLIVLDNCEHLPDACAVLIGKLLPLAPDIKIVATSRHRLGVEGEQIMHVTPFPVPASWNEEAEEFEAVQLFVERARATVPEFELTEANRATVLAICRTLDGVPLAIEFAAVWVRTLTPEQILSELDDRFSLLTGAQRGARPHQRTLQATIDWSFTLCSPAEQTLWARLSVFVGGFDLDAVEAVCSSEEIPRRHTLELVAGLLDKSVLIRLDHTHGKQARYRMLETVRSYGMARLAAAGEQAVMRARHRDYFRELSMRYEAECFSRQQADWLLRLRRDHANLRAAIEFSLAEGNGRTALELAGPTYHWISSGYVREGLTWLDRALEADTEPSGVRAKALWVRSFLATLLGDHDSVDSMLAECRVLAEQLDSTDVFYPKIWQVSGLAAFIAGDLARSAELLERARDWHLRAGPGHRHCAFDCMFQLALIAVQRKDAAAEELIEACMRFCRTHGAQWSESYALWLKAVHLWQGGDANTAMQLVRESIRLRLPVNDQTGLAFCIEAMAWCEAAGLRWRRAATLHGAAYSVWKHSGATSTDAAMHRFASEDVERQIKEMLGEAAYRTAYQEGARCSPEDAVALALLERPRTEKTSGNGKKALGVLTPRQGEIAALVAKGMSNKELAAALVISTRTAESHVEHILAKLGFTSRAQIAAWVSDRQTSQGGPAPAPW